MSLGWTECSVISRGQKHRMAETEHLDLVPMWSVGQGVSKRWGEQSREPQKARKRQSLTGWVHTCVPGIMIGILYGSIIFNPHKHPLKVSAMNNLYPEHFVYNLTKEAYLSGEKKKTSQTYFNVAMEIWEQACSWKLVSGKMIQTERSWIWNGLAGWLKHMIKMFVMANGCVCVCVCVCFSGSHKNCFGKEHADVVN